MGRPDLDAIRKRVEAVKKMATRQPGYIGTRDAVFNLCEVDIPDIISHIAALEAGIREALPFVSAYPVSNAELTERLHALLGGADVTEAKHDHDAG